MAVPSTVKVHRVRTFDLPPARLVRGRQVARATGPIRNSFGSPSVSTERRDQPPPGCRPIAEKARRGRRRRLCDPRFPRACTISRLACGPSGAQVDSELARVMAWRWWVATRGRPRGSKKTRRRAHEISPETVDSSRLVNDGTAALGSLQPTNRSWLGIDTFCTRAFRGRRRQ